MNKLPEPLSIPDSEVRSWLTGDQEPLTWRVAKALYRTMPRGKGWFPRTVGRSFGNGMRMSIPTRSGGRVAVDPRNLDPFIFVATHGGVWEQRIHDTMNAVVRPGDVVYDIGANAGIIAVDIMAHLKGQIRLFAFEPIPSLARTVAISAALSGVSDRLTVYEVMLGREGGEATLFMPHHAVHASARPRESGAVELKRTVCKLDDLVGSGMPEPDVIKIDVEGAELDVFSGARELLRRKQPVILFETDSNMVRFGYTRADLLSLLTSCAPYRFMYITPNGLVPMKDQEQVEDLGDDFNNILALPPGRSLPGET